MGGGGGADVVEARPAQEASRIWGRDRPKEPRRASCVGGAGRE